MAPPLDQRPNHKLIGVEGSRQRLATPALVLDPDAFESNIATMAEWAKARLNPELRKWFEKEEAWYKQRLYEESLM